MRRLNILFWVFPIGALTISAWLFYDYWQGRGPLVKIVFADASNVEPQKTPLRYRGINIGFVESVSLSAKAKDVIVSARLNREARRFAVEGTRFWIVQPQVDFEGVRGLETILRGSYIRVEPGDGKPKLTFRGYTGEEISDTTVGTVKYILKSRLAESISSGDPVTYRGMKIGVVSDVGLDPKSQWVETEIKIERKYAKLIRKNTLFWRKVAVQADLGLFKSKVQISSLESLLRGGIALATPDNAEKPAEASTRFNLDFSAPKDWEKWAPEL